MGLQHRIVPTLGALICAAGATGMELGPEGGLSIAGYVDVIAGYNRSGANAPRSGAMDNPGLWDRAYTEGLPYSVDLSTGTLTLQTPLGLTGDPTWNYTGGGGNPGGTYDSFLMTAAPVPWVQHVYPIVGEKQQDLDFATYAEIDVAYKILPGVTATVEVQFDDSTTVSLYNAFIDWELPRGFAFKVGKFLNWLGWEADDPRGMNRVNHSNQWAMTGVTVDGAKLAWSGNLAEGVGCGLGVNVVDTVYGDPLGVKDGDDLAFAVEGALSLGDAVSLGGSVTLDRNATIRRSAALKAFEYGTLYPAWGWVDLTAAPLALGQQDFLNQQGSWREDVLGVNLFGTIDPDGEDGFTIGFDAHWLDYNLARALGLMATVSYKVPDVPVTLTLMGSYYDPNTEDAAKYYAPDVPPPALPTGVNVYTFNNGEDDEEIELAFAVLTNPTGNPDYGVNLEVRYIHRKDLAYNPPGLLGVEIDDRSEIGVFLEFLAILP